MGCFSSKPAAGKSRQKLAPQSSRLLERGDIRRDPGLEDSHEYVGPLGRGGTGEICHFRDKRTGEQVAIKLIKRPVPRLVANNLLREILTHAELGDLHVNTVETLEIQAELGNGHVNIVEAREVLLTGRHLCLVMALAAGGTLTHYCIDKHARSQLDAGTFLSEDEARYFFKQFIDAVSFCHSNKVAHRDLKLDNTLLDGSKPPRIKLCDFGFAKNFDKGDNMLTKQGTPAYMSPSQLNSRSDLEGYSGTAVDVWAAGVLLCVMLLGQFPYDHVGNPDPNTLAARMEVWTQQVQNRWHDMPQIAAIVERMSPSCVDLLNRIFVMEEDQRITVEQVQQHPWCAQPPAAVFSVATAQLATEQLALAEENSRRHIDVKEREQNARQRTRARRRRCFETHKKKAERNARIEDLIALAALRPPLTEDAPTCPEVVIDLRDDALLENNSGAIDRQRSMASQASYERLQDALSHLNSEDARQVSEVAQQLQAEGVSGLRPSATDNGAAHSTASPPQAVPAGSGGGGGGLIEQLQAERQADGMNSPASSQQGQQVDEKLQPTVEAQAGVSASTLLGRKAVAAAADDKTPQLPTP